MSMLNDLLTDDLRTQLAQKTSTGGFTLDDIIRSGVENPDSSIGVYAPEADAYTAFGPLFDQVISSYHKHDLASGHKSDLDTSKLDIPESVTEAGDLIVSTRIRVGRNLADYAFSPGISKKARLDIEHKATEALAELTGEHAGNYFSLDGMAEEVRAQLVADHFLFKQGDRFLQSAGANRDWPSGRGIFHSADKRFLVWVNEEDHLRIISMQPGGDLGGVFRRLADGIHALQSKIPFAHSEQLGYLSSCPTNLGTAMRASTHIKLEHASARKDFMEHCDRLGLSVRGIHGEHSESEGSIYDISNKRRLGLSEIDCVNGLGAGLAELIAIERTAGA